MPRNISLVVFILTLVTMPLAVKAQTVVGDTPAQTKSFLGKISVSTEIDSGYLLPEPAYLVTDHPVVQTNAYIPLSGCVYADVWDSQRIDEKQFFAGAGDEIDLTMGCAGTLDGKYSFDVRASVYDIAGSHNNRYVVKGSLTRQFDGWDAWIGLEGQHPTGARDQAILHLGVDQHFDFVGHSWTHSPEVSVFNYGPSTFSDTLSTTVTAGGITWSPHIIVSVPTKGKAYIVAGVSFNLN